MLLNLAQIKNTFIWRPKKKLLNMLNRKKLINILDL